MAHTTSAFVFCLHVELRIVFREFVLGRHESDEMWLPGFGSRVPEVYHIARCASDTFKISKTFKTVAMREAICIHIGQALGKGFLEYRC